MKKIAIFAIGLIAVLVIEFIISLGYEVLVSYFGWSEWIVILKAALRLLFIIILIRIVFRNYDIDHKE